MSEMTEVLARGIFVAADDRHNTWPSPAHPECMKMARACIAALDAAGFQIVPKEPTPAMIEAGGTTHVQPSRLMTSVNFAGGYRAMLAAAPKAEP